MRTGTFSLSRIKDFYWIEKFLCDLSPPYFRLLKFWKKASVLVVIYFRIKSRKYNILKLTPSPAVLPLNELIASAYVVPTRVNRLKWFFCYSLINQLINQSIYISISYLFIDRSVVWSIDRSNYLSTYLSNLFICLYLFVYVKRQNVVALTFYNDNHTRVRFSTASVLC